MLMKERNQKWYLKSTFLFTLISIVNLLNYIDRGIIPGASIEINDFIQKDIDTDTPDVYLGLLQSSFIIGFMVGSVLFSHMIHTHSRFTLTGIGCSIWVVAVMLSGLSFYTGSYTFLLFARILSGFGEASMQCTIPPWIQSEAKPTQRGMWLGIFYTAIPVGTAIGYAYSALIAESIGWQFAFWLEGFAMIPFVFFMFSIAKYFPSDNDKSELEKEQRASLLENQFDPVSDATTNNEAVAVNSNNQEMDNVVQNNSSSNLNKVQDEEEGWRIASATSHADDDDVHGHHAKPSIGEELCGVVTRPVWVCITIATAAQAAVLIGISTFGAAFVMGLGFFDTEAEASTVFGIVISIAGMIATPSGGLMVDYLLARPADDVSTLPPTHLDHPNQPVTDAHGHVIAEDLMNASDPKHNSLALYRISLFIAVCTTIGTFLLCICVIIENKGLFLFMLGLGAGVVLACNPAMNMGVMLAVPNTFRAFAIAINIVCLHAFGDVPAPIIIGLIKDTLAPNCVAPKDADDDNIAASDQCRDQAEGLRLTMFFSQLWLLWTIVGAVLAAFYAHKALQVEKEKALLKRNSSVSNARTSSLNRLSHTNNSTTTTNANNHSSANNNSSYNSKSKANGLTLNPGSVTTISALHSPTPSVDRTTGTTASTSNVNSNTSNNNAHAPETRQTASLSASGVGMGVSLTTVSSSTVSPLAAKLQAEIGTSHTTDSNDAINSNDNKDINTITNTEEESEEDRLARQRENVDRFKRLSNDSPTLTANATNDNTTNTNNASNTNSKNSKKNKKNNKKNNNNSNTSNVVDNDVANL